MRFRYPHPDNERSFEKFCLKFLQRYWDNPQLRLYGHRGDTQLGIDIIDQSFSSPFRAAQCKHHEPDKTIPPAEIQEEVDKALTFSPPLEFYAILTTAKATVHAHNKILEINRKHREQKLFIVELFDWGDIETLIDEYPDIAALLTPITNSHVLQFTEIVASSFERLGTQIETTTTSLQRTAFDAEIDEAEIHLKNHDPQRAQIFFEKIKQRHWEALSPQQKYRVKIGVSNVSLVQGKDVEAGKCLLEAKDLWPESERAQINEALGLELIGDKAGARAVAAERIKSYPSASKLIAILIRTAPSNNSLEDLEALVTPIHTGDAEVALALAMKATESHMFEKAETYARQAAAANLEWFGPRFFLSQLLLNGISIKLTQTSWEQTTPRDRNRLDEAVAVMDEAIGLARRHQAHHCLADSLVVRAMANMLRGEDRGAESDFNEAIRYGPNTASLYYRYATFLFSHHRTEEAIVQLRKSIALKPIGEAEYLLAGLLSERDAPGNRHEAADIYVRLALDGDEYLETTPDETSREKLRSLREAAYHSAIEELVNADRLDEAEQFIARVPTDRFGEMAILLARSRIELSRNNSSDALVLADEALRHLADDTPECDLRSLALQLGKLERHKEALPLWIRINKATGYSNDVRHLVRCAERVKSFDVILRVAQAAREAGISDTWLLFKEVDTLELVDVERAISLLVDRIRNHPNDKHARVRLSFIGLKWGRPEIIDARLDALPTLDEATPSGGAIAVEILRQHGDPDEALRYAYELVRLYPENSDANAALIKVFHSPNSRNFTITEFPYVTAGAAVRFTENEDRERWVIIEDSPNPRQELGEYPPEHPLAIALIGKRVGDTVVLTKTSARERTAVIKEILSKYIYRVRDIIDGWQLRFQDRPYTEVYRVMTTDPVTGEEVPDFTDLKLVADKHFERTTEAEAIYKQQVIPLHLFAHLVGCNPFWAFQIAATKIDLAIRSNRGTDQEQSTALEALASSHTLVLDLTAVGLISLLQLEALLKQWRGKLVISQSTAMELRATKDDFASKKRTVGHFGKNERGYYMQEIPAETLRAQVDALNTFIDSILTACEVRGCAAMAELAPELRENLVDILGQHGTESMLLARSPGHALWTEDITVGDIAASEFSVRRVWAQPVLAHATDIGILPPDDYLAAVARLLGFDYEATSFNPFVLVKAGSMSDWDEGKWPFSKALSHFANATVPDDQVVLFAAAMVVNLFKEALLPETRQATFIAILKRIAARKHGLIAVRVLLSLLPRVFGVNVLASDESIQIGRAWLAATMKQMRFELP
jgi:tetratricopeptide (TPR) repeat protein